MLRMMTAVTTAAIYVQIIVGATMRHTGAGLAIPDFPWAFGRLIPPVWNGPIAIHFAHRVGAVIVTALVLATIGHVLYHHRPRGELRRPSLLLAALVAIQVTLGALTVLSGKHYIINSLHVVTGAMVLGTSLVLTLRAYRPRLSDAGSASRNEAAGSASRNPAYLPGYDGRQGGFREADPPERGAGVKPVTQAAAVTPADAAGTFLTDEARGAKAVTGGDAATHRLADFITLAKPRLNLLVLVTTAAGLYLAAPEGVPSGVLLHTLVGTALVAGGAAALNQVWERHTDALMRRTRRRPVASGRLRPPEGAWFGLALSSAGLVELAAGVNVISAAVAAFTLGSYVLVYTPLKRRTSLATLIGGVPGALPAVIGWVAATGTLTLPAWILFGIVFFWQMPHFLAIAWLYRGDYAAAGIPLLPVLEPDGRRTGRQALLYSAALLPVSLMPPLVGLGGGAYTVIATVLGFTLIAISARFARDRSTAAARRLFLFSITYLPLLLGALVADRLLHR